MIKSKFIKIFSLSILANKSGYAFLFSNLSLILGIVISLLTLGIMNGIEKSIFFNIKIIDNDYYVNSKKEDNSTLLYLLDSQNYNYTIRPNQEIALINNSNYRLVNSIAYSDFNSRISSRYPLSTKSTINDKNIHSIALGSDLAYNLNVKLGDTLKVLSPSNISLSMNSIKFYDAFVSHIFDINVLDYNFNLLVMPVDLNEDVFSNKYGSIGLDENTYKALVEDFSYLDVDKNLANSALLKALKVEKYLYTSFGLILVFVSCLAIYSSIQININKNRKAFSLLNVIGYKKKFMKFEMLKYIIINSIASTIIAFMFIVLLKYIDDYFRYTHILVPADLGINMSIVIGFVDYIIIGLFVNIVSIYSAYSSIKIIDDIKPCMELKA